jgi:hypothetical protein
VITQGERQQIQQILSSPQWATIERVGNLLIEQIKEQPTIDKTQWQTLQNILIREGEVRGIRRLLQELYNQVASM